MRVPLENDYKHTLYFANATDQANYFLSQTVTLVTNSSYQRKDNVIHYPAQYDEIASLNYVMYKNSSYEDKWFYAFITDMKYVNDERTDITIETDVMQTWLEEMRIKPSFVEREHTNNDAIGNNVIDEGLELGEYVTELHNIASFGGESMYIVVAVTKAKLKDSSKYVQVTGGRYDGLYSGIAYRAFPYTEAGVKKVNKLLYEYDEAGEGESIQGMFLLPASMVELSAMYPLGQDEYELDESIGGWIANSNNPRKTYINTVPSDDSYYSTITMNTKKIPNYTTLRNKKLLTFPYRYLLVSNNNGASAVYHYEDFSGNQPTFTIESCISPGGSVRMVPTNFKGAARNDEEGINLGKYPSLAWTSDMFTNWLTQNATNNAISTVSSVGSIIGGVASLVAGSKTVGAGMIVGGVMGIANTLSSINQASFSPAQAQGNTNAGDVVTVSGQNDFHFYSMTIKPQFAKIIDGYFDMFGYKTNLVKVPLKNHRENYWYTKTIDVNIDGNFANKDLNKIKECYNNGITFWSNPANIGNYSVSNNIK